METETTKSPLSDGTNPVPLDADPLYPDSDDKSGSDSTSIPVSEAVEAMTQLQASLILRPEIHHKIGKLKDLLTHLGASTPRLKPVVSSYVQEILDRATKLLVISPSSQVSPDQDWTTVEQLFPPEDAFYGRVSPAPSIFRQNDTYLINQLTVDSAYLIEDDLFWWQPVNWPYLSLLGQAWDAVIQDIEARQLNVNIGYIKQH